MTQQTRRLQDVISHEAWIEEDIAFVVFNFPDGSYYELRIDNWDLENQCDFIENISEVQ